MKVRLSELDCAVRDALLALQPSGFAEFARLAAGSEQADPELTLSEAGRAVAAQLVSAALVGSADAAQSLILAEGLSLANVRIDGYGDVPIYLPAPAVAVHPMFANWIAQSFAGSVEEMLKAGAIWTQFSIGAPIFDEIQVTDYGGAVLGVHQRFIWTNGADSLTVTASYGAAGVTADLRRVLAVNGKSLVAIGIATPLVDDAARADEAASAAAIKSAAQAAGLSVH